MPEFAHDVARFQSFLERTPYEHAVDLERMVDFAARRARPTVDLTLRHALDSGLIPPHICNLLEFLYDRWNAHSLAVKLALVARLEALSATPLLPLELLEQHPALRDIVRETAAALHGTSADAAAKS